MMADARVPGLGIVQAHLEPILQRHGFRQRLVQIERQPNPFSSAFPSEVIICTFADGPELRLLLKYGLEDKHVGHGFWGDIGYEARVYGEVLQQLTVSTPRFFGAFRHNARGQMCLVLEYLENSLRLNKTATQNLIQAARWLGEFHASAEMLSRRSSACSFLNVYDADFFSGWARRTKDFSRPLQASYPWIEPLCERFESLVPVLLEGPFSVVHGEFYPANILVCDRSILPVDWQSTAMSRGEIDLASLLEGWDRLDIVQQCEKAYQRSRWPGGAPDDFALALGVARLYWPLRWLGDEAEWTLKARRRWYFDHLRLEATYLGLL